MYREFKSLEYGVKLKNASYLPGKKVRKRVRLIVYKNALKFIKANYKSGHFSGLTSVDSGLCLLLPCMLWNVHFLDPAPNTRHWSYYETTKMFPELTKEDIIRIESFEESKDRVEYRAFLLEMWIKELTK